MLNRFGFDYYSGELILEYDLTPNEMKSMQDAVIKEVRRVVPEIITNGMTDLEKEIAINNYLCSTADYDMAALENAEENGFQSIDKSFVYSFTPYGVLVNKVGVCASYAGAFKLLGEAAGLDVVVVTGYMNGNLPHAWNRVKVDGYWMTIDSTNNDALIENVLFNIPDSITSGLLVEDEYYLMKPVLSTMKGTSETLEFYRVNDNYYSYSNLKSALEEHLRLGVDFQLRTDYNATQEEVIEALIGIDNTLDIDKW